MGCMPLNVTPSGNRSFPGKVWGRRRISRDTCSIGNHLLEESKQSQDCVCFRHFLLDLERGRGESGGGGGGEGH